MKSGWIWFACAGLALAEETQKPEEATAPPLTAAEMVAKKLGAVPAPFPPSVKGGVTMTVSAANDAVQQSVRDGLTCLHAGWDFEAFRHFASAMVADPNCLMAYWGAALALFHGNAEYTAERDAILDQMLSLVDAGVGTELEHRYVFALSKLIELGPQEAASAFGSAAKEFEDDPQLVLMQALMGRGGFDDMGDATPDQEREEQRLRDLIGKYPDLLYLKHALLAMRAEAPDLEKDLELARTLCLESPDFAPYFHVLGHYEWRCGNHGRAQAAFGRAADLYAAWMRRSGLGAVDCPGWTRAECYRAAALASKGDYETALAVAEGLSRIAVNKDKASSDGGRMILWEAATLPSRLLLRRGGAGDMKIAKDLLPHPDIVKGMGEYTLAVWSLQAHSTVVGARLALEAKDMESARTLAEDLTRLGGNFVQTRNVAVERAEASQWARAFRNMEVMASELNGLLSMAGPEKDRGSAFNWYRSAADRQRRSTLMMPPGVMLPMEARLAEFHMGKNEPEKAMDTLLEGLAKWPRDYELLIRLKEAATKGKDKEMAAEAEEQLKLLSEQ
ncbi:MAG: hypothetical protein MUF31_00675 [Akkermansiaceae bacterium]|nr:hypothetical protein [Akkermansiaceae bacterium]